MSTHAVNIITVDQLLPHSNADKLEIVPIGSWQAVARKGQFKVGDRAIFIEPDYTVPTTRPEFAFLAKPDKDRHRLKAVRLRGALSYGLLIEVPEDLAHLQTGADVMSQLEIERYVPPADIRTSADELAHDQWPAVHAPKFDIEPLNKFQDLLRAGEPVMITEKVHGANARYTFVDGKFHMGSRNRWIQPAAKHIWSLAAAHNPGIEAWCRRNQGLVLYGEVYGPVQSLQYGRSDAPAFVAFAASEGGNWISQSGLFIDLQTSGVPHVPVLWRGPFDVKKMREIAEGDSHLSALPGHIMEGVVVVPIEERWHSLCGRVAFKHISNRYWLCND